MISLPFKKEEFLERVKNVQNAMAERGIDVLLVTEPSNIYYLAGYDAKSYYVDQLLVVSLDDPMPHYIGRYMDAFSSIPKTTWIDKSHVHAYGDEYVQSKTKHPMDCICKMLIEMGFGHKTIGVETEVDFIMPIAYQHYVAGLPDANLVNGSLIVNRVRLVKSDSEIEFMRRSGKIAEKLIAALYNTYAPGVRQCDVAAAVLEASIRGTDEFGGDYPAGPPMFPSCEQGGCPHLTWNDERFPEQHTMFLETAAVYRRYHTPVSRTVALGQPSEQFMTTAKAAIEGLESVLAAAKEGVTCADLELAWRKTVSKFGIEKESRIGYSIGIGYPPTWGERTISLRSADKTVLKENMCIHCIPGMYYDNYGLSISQAFRITKTGIEKFYEIPFDVVIK